MDSGSQAPGELFLAPLLARYHPAITILELGGNDALRGIPLDLTRTNLREMIAASRKAGSRVIVVGMRIPPNYGPDYSEQFFNMFSALAKQEKTGYVPFLLAGVVEHPDWFQQDQIHPLAKAHPQILQNVWPTVKPLVFMNGPQNSWRFSIPFVTRWAWISISTAYSSGCLAGRWHRFLCQGFEYYLNIN